MIYDDCNKEGDISSILDDGFSIPNSSLQLRSTEVATKDREEKMITVQSKSFTPFGRQFSGVHPRGGEESLNNEVWYLEDGTESTNIEQEVYANGSVVIWSEITSNTAENNVSRKCYSLDNAVKQIKACHYSGSSDSYECSQSQIDMKNYDDDKKSYICVLESTCVELFGADGSSYSCPLPFQVEELWPLPNGFCVQREAASIASSHSNRIIPTLFSLIHPLDDFSPVVYRYPDDKKSFYFADNDQRIVFSSPDLPLLVTFDNSVGIHTVWKIRKATVQDKPDLITTDENAFDVVSNLGSRIPSRLSTSAVCTSSGYHVNSPSPTLVSRSRALTPRPVTPIPLARLNSPTLKGNGQPTRAVSPHSAIMHEASASSDNTFGNTSQNRGHSWFPSPMIYRLPSEEPSIHEEHEFESMPPSICLELTWQEDASSDDATTENNLTKKATSVFISEDLCGHNFLCFMLKERHILRLIEMEHRLVTSSFYFGSSAEISALDAGPLTKLKMIVVFDSASSLMLYSGTVTICRIDAFTNIEKFSTLNASGLDLLRSCYGSATPFARSSPLDTSTMFHPISSLRDFTGQKFSMVLETGDIYRISVPRITSYDLVSNCLDVIMRCIDSSASIELIGRYYFMLNESTCQSFCQWKIFMDNTLLLMGFPELVRKSIVEDEGSSPAPPQPKRSKKSDSFCENVDWEYMVETDLFSEIREIFHDSGTSAVSSTVISGEEIRLHSSSPLYSFIPKLFHGLHLLYEDLKLNTLTIGQRKNLAQLQVLLSSCLRLENYKNYYIKDFPEHFRSAKRSFPVQEDQLNELFRGDERFSHPKSIERYLIQEISLAKMLPEFSSPFKVTQLIAKTLRCITSYVTSGVAASPDSMISELEISGSSKLKKQTCTEKLLDILFGFKFCKSDIERLPFGLAVIFQELFHHYRHIAPSHLSATSAKLLNRDDIAAQRELFSCKASGHAKGSPDVKDGELFRMRFSCDLRIEEVKNLLDSSIPVNINIGQKPEVSDHDFIKEQEAKLVLLSKRTMSLPVGRGMFSMATHFPMIGETIDIPTLELTGKATQSNKLITQTDLSADHLQWPSFHNGVATGLRVVHHSSQIDSTWIVYNKLKYKELNEELSGFMLGLGLTGHLHVLPPHLIHDYLAKGREFTSVALLLGISASKCRSKDASVYKLLAVHVDALLPPTALEISIPHSAQVAALLSTGLLYMETMERHLVKILLQEISRPPGPEMENSIDRESHSLAAGFALGMVLLGKGTDSLYLSDLRIAEELHHLTFGGQQCGLPTYLRENFKSPSYLIKEGDSLNTEVTCPSAIMALALIFLKTNNKVVANWFESPDTAATLDAIKPDNLLLMLLARGLILWDETLPSIDWVQHQIPKIFDNVSFDAKQPKDYEIDEESLRFGYCCVVAGCCMSVGIKFAGSTNKAAFETLMHFTKVFKKLAFNPIFEKGGKSIVEMCLATVLLSVSMVMAGSGNLQVLRIARSLRRRVHADISYGIYMAVHMAIGFLFLGGGRFTLSTDNKAIASLLCALYPKFPCNSRDNRYHLQAFRHLYILACEPRFVIPRDVESGAICYAPLVVTFKDTKSFPSSSIRLLAPCIIPEFSVINEIQVQGPRYWPITIKVCESLYSKNDIAKILGCLFVKRKAGYLSYSDDPKGHRNLMARTFAHQSEFETLSSSSSDLNAVLLGEVLSKEKHDSKEVNSDFLSNALFECACDEKLDVLPAYIQIEKILIQAENGAFDDENMAQLELLFHFYNILHPKLKSLDAVGKPLINENYLIQVQIRLEKSKSSQKRNSEFAV